MTSKVFICKICGDAYLGEEAPTNCPFCGARKEYILKGNEFDPKINDIELSEADTKHLSIALNLELHAAQIYLCSANKAENYEIKKMFKRLSKIEGEHASLISKVLKGDKQPLPEETCKDTEHDNIQNAYDLEANAVKVYQKALTEVTSDRVKEIFKALMEAEEDHEVILKEKL